MKSLIGLLAFGLIVYVGLWLFLPAVFSPSAVIATIAAVL
jgi:hypothetical protein